MKIEINLSADEAAELTARHAAAQQAWQTQAQTPQAYIEQLAHDTIASWAADTSKKHAEEILPDLAKLSQEKRQEIVDLVKSEAGKIEPVDFGQIDIPLNP